jgi:hypothetical protein
MKILNPNCSEVIARLPVKNMVEGKKLLKSIGLDTLRLYPYLNINISLTNGKEVKRNMILDPDNPNLPDYEHRSTLFMEKADYEEGKGIYVQGYQHCQIQLYPTIKKIQDELGIEFYGYSGGYDFEECFEGWLNEGAIVEDYQKPLYDKIRKILEDEKIKNITKNVFEVVDCVENKKHSTREKYLLLKKAYRRYLEENKEELIKEKKEDERYIMQKVTDDQILKQLVDYAMFAHLDVMFDILDNKKLRERVFNK